MAFKYNETQEALVGVVEQLPAESQLKKAAQEVLTEVENPDFNNRQVIDRLQIFYRIQMLAKLGLSGVDETSDLARSFLDESPEDVEPLGVDPELIRAFAKNMYDSVAPKQGETIIISGTKKNIEIICELVKLCEENNVDFRMELYDSDKEVSLIKNTPAENMARLAGLRVALYKDVVARMSVTSAASTSSSSDPGKSKIFRSHLGEITSRIRSGEIRGLLTFIPTQDDAGVDEMGYDQYIRLFFEACDQPEAEIEAAETILKGILDKAGKIHITNDDGTDIEFDNEGFIWVHDKMNVPGSEIHSAPKLEGVNGKVVAKGKFRYGSSPIMEDLVFEFEKGKVKSCSAKGDNEALQEILKETGMDFVGELAFGTNPHLTRSFLNPLLCEKVSGSFHFALGGAFEQQGINNGNRAKGHWDITTLLRGKGGKVYADDVLIQDNGEWVVDGTKVLNKGWGALPEDKQPGWYRNR